MVLLLVVCCVIYVHGQPISENLEDEVKNSTQFSLDFYRQYFNKSENAILSPISFRIILSIVYQSVIFNSTGASELQNVLHLPSNTRASRKSQLSLIQVLLENPSLRLSNKIYVTDKYELRQRFKKRIATYKSEIESVNFNEKVETSNKINEWVKNKTEGQITSLMTPDAITSDLMVLLVNTMYFKGKWDEPFDRDLIYRPFYGYDKTHDSIAYMKKKQADVGYAKLDSIKSEILEIYYNVDTNNRFWLILPEQQSNIGEVVSLLTLETINEIQKNLYDRPVDLEMPTFTIENEIDGNAYMKKMGLDSVFSGSEFDMVRNGPPLSISDMKQKTKLIVNTDGTEAAVASCKYM